MSGNKDKRRKIVGIVILIVLFLIFIVILIQTIRPFSSDVKSFDKSLVIKQRIINLEKSNK